MAYATKEKERQNKHEYYLENMKKLKQVAQDWQNENREKVRELHRLWTNKNKERVHQYRQKQKERRLLIRNIIQKNHESSSEQVIHG